ncbi:hypothetical protein B5181_11300 [Streptomyces sp. 4F]|nr:hypothetical protein B5181_11300 [Streptomyces sp. 4F]
MVPLLAGVWFVRQQPFHLWLGVAGRARQHLMVVGGQDAGSKSASCVISIRTLPFGWRSMLTFTVGWVACSAWARSADRLWWRALSASSIPQTARTLETKFWARAAV